MYSCSQQESTHHSGASLNPIVAKSLYWPVWSSSDFTKTLGLYHNKKQDYKNLNRAATDKHKNLMVFKLYELELFLLDNLHLLEQRAISQHIFKKTKSAYLAEVYCFVMYTWRMHDDAVNLFQE